MRIRPNDDGNRPMPEHFMPDLEDPSAPGTRMQPKFFLTTAKLPVGSARRRPPRDARQWLTGNEWFAVAAVNRMWAELVGEGFYEPIDDVGPDRTRAAPERSKLLAANFRRSGYDMKWLVETICATEAYQRQSRPRRSGEGDAVRGQRAAAAAGRSAVQRGAVGARHERRTSRSEQGAAEAADAIGDPAARGRSSTSPSATTPASRGTRSPVRFRRRWR